MYLCENNGYAITTALASSHAQPSIAKRADSYGMPGVCVDGQDVSVVYEAVAEAVLRARRGLGPTLIEAKTYRFDEHQVGLVVPGKPYRTVSEVDDQKANRDPIVLYRKVLLQSGFSEAELHTVENEVVETVTAAIRFGEVSPFPDPASLYDYLYCTPLAGHMPQHRS